MNTKILHIDYAQAIKNQVDTEIKHLQYAVGFSQGFHLATAEEHQSELERLKVISSKLDRIINRLR